MNMSPLPLSAPRVKIVIGGAPVLLLEPLLLLEVLVLLEPVLLL